MDFDPLAATGVLPESVKRKILACLKDQQRNEVQHSTDVACLPVTGLAADVDDLSQQVAGRQIVLPSLHAGAAVVDNVLTAAEIQAAQAGMISWLTRCGRRPGMGSTNAGGLWHDADLRGDINCWVSPEELKDAGQQVLAACLQMMSTAQHQLAQQGYNVSGRCSCQLACYPGNSARYVRHTDASHSAPSRTVTALLYLNPDWDPQADGGQLVIYNTSHSQQVPSTHTNQPAAATQPLDISHGSAPHHPTASTCTSSSTLHVAQCPADAPDVGAGYQAGEPALVVAPCGGRLVLFDSRLQHEVLPAHKPRYAITLWFYRGTAAQQGRLPCGTGPAAAAAQGPLCTHPRQSAAPASSVREHTSAAASPPDQHVPSDSTGSPALQPCAATGKVSPESLPALPQIFVSVAAFRDPECQWTLRDLFLKAAHPGRVQVGVVWQHDPESDDGFVRMAGGSRVARYATQVREVRCHYHTATGPCAARSLAQHLWAGEQYVLQVDAHMRFVQDWDELCLSELQAAQDAAGHQRVVLSTYPLGYDGQGAAAAVPECGPATLLCAREFDAVGLLRLQSKCLQQRPATPLPSAFWAAGFSFAPATWLLEVPYCPHLPHLFFGEEQYMLLRMWTRGWDVYAPTQPLAFHQWQRAARLHTYQTCGQIDEAVRAASQARVLEMTTKLSAADALPTAPVLYTGIQQPAPGFWHLKQTPSEVDWRRGGIWGLGTRRSVQEFELMAGVSFDERTIDDRALFGGQPSASFEV